MNKCREYTQQRLRAPPFSLVQQWGKKLKLPLKDIQSISDSLPLRHALGNLPPPPRPSPLWRKSFCLILVFFLAPERGSLNNTSKYKKTTPTCFRSPFTVQGDLGFISTNKKKYGIFFVAVQTFSRRIFCIPIKNSKSSTLIEAIQAMLKVRLSLSSCG